MNAAKWCGKPMWRIRPCLKSKGSPVLLSKKGKIGPKENLHQVKEKLQRIRQNQCERGIVLDSRNPQKRMDKLAKIKLKRGKFSKNTPKERKVYLLIYIKNAAGGKHRLHTGKIGYARMVCSSKILRPINTRMTPPNTSALLLSRAPKPLPR